ncbi:MAG: hypothetical protein IPO78_17220 [Saprospiraceae bacterium]|nr:hypothetical protein [Saprospiraceae bacterium]
MTRQQFELQAQRFAGQELGQNTLNLYWGFWIAMEWSKQYEWIGRNYQIANELFQLHLLTKEINPIITKTAGYKGDRILFTRSIEIT